MTVRARWRSRGFVISPFIWSLLPYALGALAVAGAATVAYQYVDNRWATDAGIAEGRKRESAKLQPQIDQLRSQATALSAAVNACNAGVDEAKRAGRAAVDLGTQLLAEARKAGQAAQKAAARSDAIARGPAQPGRDCRDAWAEIESGRSQ